MLTPQQQNMVDLILNYHVRSFHDMVVSYLVDVESAYSTEVDLQAASRSFGAPHLYLESIDEHGVWKGEVAILKPKLKKMDFKAISYEFISLLRFLEEQHLIVLLPEAGRLLAQSCDDGSEGAASMRDLENRLHRRHEGRFWIQYDIIPLPPLATFQANGYRLREEVALGLAVQAQSDARRSQKWTTTLAIVSIVLSIASILLGVSSAFIEPMRTMLLQPIVNLVISFR